MLSLMLFCFSKCSFISVTGSSEVPYMMKRMTHKPGWMALLPSGNTFTWSFINATQLTNISYTATFYGFKVHMKTKPLKTIML